ncbi:MAG TPA: acyl-CoA dehydratase activase [Syntrophales bacterium]|nr:acyl-CoA dehydratase activase [Syntrophales bacterium]
MQSESYYVGIDAGSVSLNAVVIRRDKSIAYEAPYTRHMGRVEEETRRLIRDLRKRLGEEHISAFAFTGNHGRTISERTGAFYEFETISQVTGALFLRPDARTIISMGGQDTALFQIRHDATGWELEYFNANGPCASGTGSFIDQQAQRLSTSIYSSGKGVSSDGIDRILRDFISLGLSSAKPATVACRCTVFTKSDMIHLQNKGERLQDIIYGLHVGNARNYMSTIVSNRTLESPLLFIGGLSLNELQARAFRAYFPDLLVPPHSTSTGALGVALCALERGLENRLDLEALESGTVADREKVPAAPKLELRETRFPEDNGLPAALPGGKTPVYLGIDIGSTTTKYAVVTEDRQLIDKSYLPTRGKPIEVTQTLLKRVGEGLRDCVTIRGVATTGSGRNVVGDFLNADLILDEITAHARGAVEIDCAVDTIFEIGGQDSKYISITDANPLDFDMNKVCAAGTGSFLHELANKHGINIVGEFQDIALSSERPVKLAERCTVFMESDLVSYHQQGVLREDLIGGLCYAVVYNYLNRVVGKRRIGRRVMFLGGPSLNKGVVAAFEKVLGRGLILPKHREVLGAFGAAVCLQEKMAVEKRRESTFRGISGAIADRMDYAEKVCVSDPGCHNRCKLKIYDFGGRKSIWGGECGRYEAIRGGGGHREDLFKVREEVWTAAMSGVFEELAEKPLLEVEGRPTVGMQRSLYTLQTGVFWAHFFDRLGYRLVLTPSTNGRISSAGIESMTAETCYPVKVSHGHVGELLGKTRFIFLPGIVTMPTPVEQETGFTCPLVQANPFMVRAALGIGGQGVLNPILHLKHDLSTLALELAEQMAASIRRSRRRIREAAEAALEEQRRFNQALFEKGREVLESHDPAEPMVVVTGRPYNLYDERLNLHLGRNLAKIGTAAVPMDFIDVSSVDLGDFPNMYWALGAQILRTAKFIRSRPNVFGLHLTNFSCGADSFIEHFYRYIMQEKPCLILELDEHSAMAGVMTRLEAFRNVLDHTMRRPESGVRASGRVSD